MNYFFEKREKKEKMNMNELFMRLNLNLIYGAQGSINMTVEKISQKWIYYCYLKQINQWKGIDWKTRNEYQLRYLVYYV